MDPRHLVEMAFSQPQKCAGHCNQQASLKFIGTGEPTLACYACPTGYVSKVMVYSPLAPDGILRKFLAEAMDGRVPKEDEIRTATRHSWDLGTDGVEMKVAYWTQNYRSSKSDSADRPALFLCSNCGSPYVKPLSATRTTCGNCGH